MCRMGVYRMGRRHRRRCVHVRGGVESVMCRMGRRHRRRCVCVEGRDRECDVGSVDANQGCMSANHKRGCFFVDTLKELPHP